MEETVPVIIDGEQEPDTKQEVSGLSTSPQVIPMKIRCQVDGCDMSFPVATELMEHAKKAHNKDQGGRPCGLCKNLEAIEKKVKAYLDRCRGTDTKKPRIPYLQEIADMLDIDKDTIMDWSNKLIEGTEGLEHPEFNRLVKAIVNLQELRLNQKLMGRYNPTGAIFLLKTKHKYIETEKQILAGDKNEPLEITFTEDKKHKYE